MPIKDKHEEDTIEVPAESEIQKGSSEDYERRKKMAAAYLFKQTMMPDDALDPL